LHIRAIILVGIMLSIVTGVTLGAVLYRDQHRGSATAVDRNASLFDALLKKVQSNYYRELTEEELLDGAFNGVMATLDEHSRYLNSADITDLQEDTSGRFGGIGVEVGVINGQLEIVRPMPNPPASRAGIVAGDVITGVDDYHIAEGDISGAMQRLRGAPGTLVTLHLQRSETGGSETGGSEGTEGTTQALSVDVERAEIRINSVRSRLLEPGYGYLRISQFRSGTELDLRDALASLSANDPLRGLVLDLRNNPGGLLQSSVAIADAFLNAGEIVSTRGRDNEIALQFAATTGDLLNGAPIVVLINGGSASAAEIVAGALQDNQRAVLLGTRSFGKGSVQTVMPVANDHAIKLTTALYYTPSGRSIQKLGIKPDQEVTVAVGRSYESTLLEMALDNLKNHPDNAANPAAPVSASRTNANPHNI